MTARPLRQKTYTREFKIRVVQEAIEGDGYCDGYRKLTHWLRREHQLNMNEKVGEASAPTQRVFPHPAPRRSASAAAKSSRSPSVKGSVPRHCCRPTCD